MASYITERTFGQIPMSAQIVVPEDLAPVLKAVTEIPSAEESQENDIVQLIREQPGYIAGRYYQYLKNTDTGEYSWVDISTNIPTGKQAGVGVYVHVGSRVFLMWVDPPGMFSNMRQITAAEIANGPSPLIQYYVIVDISPEDQPGTAYGYTLAGENGFISAFEEGVNYYVECEANEWVRAEVYLADVNGIIIEGESALISSDIQNEYAVDGCGVTNPRLNVAHLSETYKFILREYFADGSYVDNPIQPMQLQANANTLFYQSDWKDHNPLSIAYIRGKPLLLRKLLINKDGDLIAYADDENALKHLYIDDDGNLIYEYSDDEEEIDSEASDGSNKKILDEDDVMPANASLGDIRKLLKTLWSRAGGTVKALVAAACLFGGSSYAADPGTTTDEHIYADTPIVTNAWQAVKKPVTDLVNEKIGGIEMPLKKGTLSDAQIANGITFTSNGYSENGAIEVGEDAHGAVSQEAIDGVTTRNYKIRNVGIAVGTRAVAEGSSSTKNQSIAIGYSAHAKGSCATAIGPGAKHLDDEDDDTGHNAYADGSTALAIGYATKAKGTAATAIGAGVSGGKKTIASADRACSIGQAAQSTAPGAFQLGTGLNSTPNSLQFMDTTIVKDGKVVGGFDPSELDPKEVIVSATDYEVTAKAHAMTTLTVSDTKSTYPEIEISPETTRNYEIFFDNTDENRMQLPLIISDEGRGLFVRKTEFPKILRIPVTIKVKEPRKDRVLVDVEYIDDGYEWNPVITNMTADVSADGGFAVENLTCRGTELHFLTGACLKLTYGSTVVEHLIKVSSALYDRIMCDTFRTSTIPTSVMYIGTGDGFRVEKPITW